MKRRSFLKTVSAASLGVGVTPAWSVPHLADQQAPNPSDAQKAPEHASPETILLKDYLPKSLYKIPVNQVPKAKYPIIRYAFPRLCQDSRRNRRVGQEYG